MKLRDFTAQAVETDYWMPGAHYPENIAKAIEGRVDNGDIVAVSEKALSTAKGWIIDESQVKPGLLANLIASVWMRIVWGRFLGRVCHLKAENIRRLRNYPLKEGSTHKQVALVHAGFLHALLWGSEGGIDAGNLPYSYVSLPLENPRDVAEEIRLYLSNRLGKKVTVVIVDTDKTNSYRGFHFTHRPSSLKGIHSFLGIVAYVAGRTLGLRRRSTPLAIAGSSISVDLALDIAEVAHRRRGSGAGLTVWDMAERFGVSVTSVTWSMLRSIRHKPIVIFKRRRGSIQRPRT